MLACIPTRGNAGHDDIVNSRFGSAPYFTLYNTESDELTLVPNTNAHHSHGTCHPINQLADRHIDCVICAAMGRRAVDALNNAGIKIYRAPSKKVGEILDWMKAGKLTEMDPAKACQGQGAGGQGGGCHGTGRGTGHGQGEPQR